MTAAFWVIMILATTLGETAGDTVSRSMKLGYLAAAGMFAAILVLLVWRQTASRRYRPFLYWATIIASTTAGTTMADFATRSLGIGYAGGSLIMLGCVAGALLSWHRTLGSVSVATIREPRAELFYWLTITLYQALGTALGDWTADTGRLGYGGAAIVFGAMLAVIAALYLWRSIDRVLLFWSAFILIRPLGAAVGDLLDQPFDHGGLAFSPPSASSLLVGVIVLLVALWPLYPPRTRTTVTAS